MGTTQSNARGEWDWTPHNGGQAEVANSDARHRVVGCGRRWGKTELAAREAVRRAVSSSDTLIWWVAPTYKETKIGYETVEDIARPSLADAEDCNRSPPQSIRFNNEWVSDSRIEFRSADREGGLVGVGLDLLVLDEAAKVPEHSWKKELRPTLLDTKGDMIAISTPEGENWFHEWFQRGQNGDEPNVESWQRSTYDNPHVSDEEIDSMRDEMPERIFEQEILAKFTDASGGVFTDADTHFGDYAPDAVSPEPPHATGVDLARQQDYTVITTFNARGRVVYYWRGQEPWRQIQKRVNDVYEEYEGAVAVDATRDNKLVADLERDGVNVIPVRFTSQRKADLVENLVAAYESDEIELPDIPQMCHEFKVFGYDTTRAGNVRYSAPEGMHDDVVDSVALAYDTLDELVNGDANNKPKPVFGRNY
jgi:hypothetical protein